MRAFSTFLLVLSLTVLAVVGWQRYRYERAMEAHLDEQGRPGVVLYVSDNCGGCEHVRQFLRRRHVPFAEYDVHRSPDVQQRFQDIRGDEVPLLFVGEERFEQFDASAVGEALVRWEYGFEE